MKIMFLESILANESYRIISNKYMLEMKKLRKSDTFSTTWRNSKWYVLSLDSSSPHYGSSLKSFWMIKSVKHELAEVNLITDFKDKVRSFRINRYCINVRIQEANSEIGNAKGARKSPVQRYFQLYSYSYLFNLC